MALAGGNESCSPCLCMNDVLVDDEIGQILFDEGSSFRFWEFEQGSKIWIQMRGNSFLQGTWVSLERQKSVSLSTGIWSFQIRKM